MPPSDDGVDETLDALDGIIFSGGGDLDPVALRRGAAPETTGTRPERDKAELALIQAALDRDMPVLAVCRGSQLLNVARGGDLVQHLPDVVGDERHKQTHGDVRRPRGRSSTEDAAAARCWGSAPRSSRTTTRASGGSATVSLEAACAPDGTVEALEDPSRASRSPCSGIRRRARTCALFEELVDRGGALPRGARMTVRREPGDRGADRRVEQAGVEEIDAAVARAEAAFPAWRAVAPADRARLLRRLATLVEEHAEELALLETRNVGKPIADSRGEVGMVADVFHFYAGAVDKHHGETIPVAGGIDMTFREPLGVVGLIVPVELPAEHRVAGSSAPRSHAGTPSC